MARIILLKEISSTQDFALEFLSDGKLVQPTFIVSEKQTNGRGRCRERNWISEKGNFHGSLCLNISILNIDRQNVFSLNTIVLHALFNFLQKIDSTLLLRLKLPNDIYLNGKKLAGVLIEIFYPIAIIGIGINLAYAPLPTAANLQNFTKSSIDINKTFISALENEIISLIIDKHTVR